MGNAVSGDRTKEVVLTELERKPHTVAVEAGAQPQATAVAGSAVPQRSVVFRAATHPSELVDNLTDYHIENACGIFEHGLSISRDEPCLGSRFDSHLGRFPKEPTALKAGQTPGHQTPGATYKWLSYAEVEEKVAALGAALTTLNLVEEKRFEDEVYGPAKCLRICGVASKNRPEWFITDLACLRYGLTSCPLYDTLGEAALVHMLTVTKLSCILGSAPGLTDILKILVGEDGAEGAGRVDVRSVVCFDTRDMSGELEELANKLEITVYYFHSLIAQTKIAGGASNLGSNAGVGVGVGVGVGAGVGVGVGVGPASVASICFTSGTTGMPKGVIVTHGAIIASACAALRGPLTGQGIEVTHSDCYISYLPLSHVLERMLTFIVILIGGRLAVYSGDPKTLLDDMKIAQPTFFASVPRLFVRVNDKIGSGLRETNPVARFLFERALQSKLNKFRREGAVTNAFWDRFIFARLRPLLGGKLRYMLSGGAALAPAIQERISLLFSVPFLEGYGLTETMGTTFVRRADDCLLGHIGAVLPSTEFCIEGDEELDYDARHPTRARGELLLKGRTIFPNYFRNPAATAAAFTSDGWFCTGDVVVRMAELGGRIKIIDRKKNIFKLSQGEYVAPERLELLYGAISVFSVLFVYGDSHTSQLVALATLDEEEVVKVRRRVMAAANHAPLYTTTSSTNSSASLIASKDSSKEASKEDLTLGASEHPSLEQIVQEKWLLDLVKTEASAIETEARLKGFQKVKAFKIIPQFFTPENGMLTPTFKLKRNVVLKTYKAEIQDLLKSVGESSPFVDAL